MLRICFLVCGAISRDTFYVNQQRLLYTYIVVLKTKMCDTYINVVFISEIFLC